MTEQKWFAVAGALLAFSAVAAGAFGAHLLKQKLSEHYLGIFEIGVKYQIYHALAMFVVAWAIGVFPHSATTIAGWLFLTGTLIFSGSLYILALSQISWWGAITPIGGVLLLAGWLSLAVGMVYK